MYVLLCCVFFRAFVCFYPIGIEDSVDECCWGEGTYIYGSDFHTWEVGCQMDIVVTGSEGGTAPATKRAEPASSCKTKSTRSKRTLSLPPSRIQCHGLSNKQTATMLGMI